jgi:hypothetical protein
MLSMVKQESPKHSSESPTLPAASASTPDQGPVTPPPRMLPSSPTQPPALPPLAQRMQRRSGRHLPPLDLSKAAAAAGHGGHNDDNNDIDAEGGAGHAAVRRRLHFPRSPLAPQVPHAPRKVRMYEYTQLPRLPPLHAPLLSPRVPESKSSQPSADEAFATSFHNLRIALWQIIREHTGNGLTECFVMLPAALLKAGVLRPFLRKGYRCTHMHEVRTDMVYAAPLVMYRIDWNLQ